MILVVMAGMAILFGFVGSYTSNFQAGTGSSVLESLTVEQSWFNESSPQHLVLWVYNTGKIDFKINSVFVNGFKVEPTAYKDSAEIDLKKTVILIGDHVQLDIKISTPASSYPVKIQTERGSGFEGVYS
jgi:hypothetical protein